MNKKIFILLKKLYRIHLQLSQYANNIERWFLKVHSHNNLKVIAAVYERRGP